MPRPTTLVIADMGWVHATCTLVNGMKILNYTFRTCGLILIAIGRGTAVVMRGGNA